MSFKVHFLLIIIFIPSIGCVHYYYAPNAQNVPLLKEKKDTRIITAVSAGDEFSGFEAQFATAIKKNMGLMTNFITASGSYSYDSGSAPVNSESGRGFLFEIGAGYYKQLVNHNVFEIYIGGGLGSVSNDYSQGSSKVNFTRLFIQPNLGFTKKWLEFALSIRLAGLNYYYIDYSSLEPYDIDDLKYIENNSFSLLLEPAITIRVGWKHTKIQLQFVHSKNANNEGLSQEVRNFNLGLHFYLPTKK